MSAQLTVNWSTPLQIQNTLDIIGVVPGDFQKDNTFISPLTISKYMLYYRAIGRVGNFGWDNGNYLSYEGGFITCGDKVNTKYSDFTIKQNLTVTGLSFFNQGMNLIDIDGQRTNTINNLKSLTQQEFLSKVYDNNVVSKKDYLKRTRYKGMMTLWSGTYADLVSKLPLWRLCAPPDSDRSENGIFIPNLQGKFVLGATYTEYGAFQPKDNFNNNFGPTISIDNGNNVGGAYNHTLTVSELPKHRHENVVVLSKGVTRVFIAGPNGTELPATFYTSVPTIRIDDTNNHSGGVWSTTSGLWRSPTKPTTITCTTTPFSRTILSQNARGGRASDPVFPEDAFGPYNTEHTNMPPYYALAYIIYVETPRG